MTFGRVIPGLKHPQGQSLPTPAQMRAAYPPAARRAKLGGLATLECVVARQGLLADCHVKSEDPPGQGFGAAALMLAPAFQVAPFAAGGGHVTIPVRFQPG